MNYYQDITFVSNTEINLGFIWQKVFQQVHIALVDNGYDIVRKGEDGRETHLKKSKIGVSFPAYADKVFPLGNTLRLLAAEHALLEGLNIEKWLHRLQDYVSISSIKEVPDSVAYVGFRRNRIKGEMRLERSLQKKARHIADKFGVDFKKTLAELQESHVFEKLDLPYIQVESQSSAASERKPRFKLFIDKIEYQHSQYGEYDCYGLSKTATVPWF